ncbi:hypothetical protein [Bradyrhizobium stylosanthis]|uniref:hypothetical protein n=1 Tax=Bradyrhizobium stylosanthis TaxID=1803665 RepID=UPI0007C45CB7|nr:hypothetical protein [Bradyrhizobium stylosanthis]
MQAVQTHTTSRRSFLAGAAVAALAVTPVAAVAAATADDAELLGLRDQIFEAWEASLAHDDETALLPELRETEYNRLLAQERSSGRYISSYERHEAVYAMPEVQRLDQLVALAEEHFERMAELVEQMWGIPATTEAGRSAKVQVLLSCIMDWRQPDEEMDWSALMARRLLVDLVGGAEAESFREIYA